MLGRPVRRTVGKGVLMACFLIASSGLTHAQGKGKGGIGKSQPRFPLRVTFTVDGDIAGDGMGSYEHRLDGQYTIRLVSDLEDSIISFIQSKFNKNGRTTCFNVCDSDDGCDSQGRLILEEGECLEVSFFGGRKFLFDMASEEWIVAPDSPVDFRAMDPGDDELRMGLAIRFSLLKKEDSTIAFTAQSPGCENTEPVAVRCLNKDGTNQCDSWDFEGHTACYTVVREPNIFTIGELSAIMQFEATIIE